MISLLICNGNDHELKAMENLSHYLAGYLTEEYWDFNLCSDTYDIEKYLEENQVFDIVCIDITLPYGIEMAERIRKINSYAYIILVASTDISPVKYLKPTIFAGSLLMRVYSKSELESVFENAFRAYFNKFDSDNEKEDVYVIDSREGRQVVPYNQIYYFEARDKKIIVGCMSKEVACYDTISNLEENLPKNFIRCHRSFIVNRNKVVNLILAKNMIILEDDICIPISRTYKVMLKDLFK